MLEGASRKALDQLAQRCHFRKFDAGRSILAVEEPSRFVCIGIEGLARVMLHAPTGRAIAFRDIGPGDVFGELAAIDGQARSANVEAVTVCTIAAIEADDFLSVLDQQPTLARIVMRHLAAQIRSLTARVYELSALSVASRIRAEIVRLALQAPDADGVRLIRPMPRHEELASRLATHREAVSREIAHLAGRKIVARARGALIVKDLRGLAALVHGNETVQPEERW
jgi:CRP-like cAMP-binding protein